MRSHKEIIKRSGSEKREGDESLKRRGIIMLAAAMMLLAAGCSNTSETAKPAETVEPAETAKPMEPVELTEPAEPVEPTEPVEPAAALSDAAVNSGQQESLQNDNNTKETSDAGDRQSPPDQQKETASSGQPDGQDPESPVILRNLNADGSLLSQTYYQAGNVNNRMEFYVLTDAYGDEFPSDRLGISVTEMIPQYNDTADDRGLAVYAEARVETVPGQNTYQTELVVSGYRDLEQVFKDTYRVMVSLPGNGDPDGAVNLWFADKGAEGRKDAPKEVSSLAGAYYGMNSERDLFTRYLCRAELCAYPAEDLRLMRNTIYAAHGRKFQDQVLKEYMGNRPWYRALVEAEDFSEKVLSDVERKNIVLLKELEDIPFDQRRKMYGADYSVEEFEAAPYLPFLSQNRETGLSADFTQAEDCGAYYRVPGKLYLPVTLTRKQWEAVRNGGKAELCSNEVTGETRILELDSTNNYRFYEKGAEPDFTWPSDIHIHYHYDTGLYELQEASDDTIMKPVYEGDLYFLKGSVQGGMVSLTTASELQEEITPQTQEVYANCLYHNGRGYFTAVYALGD